MAKTGFSTPPLRSALGRKRTLTEHSCKRPWHPWSAPAGRSVAAGIGVQSNRNPHLVFVGAIVATEVAPTRTRGPCGPGWERRSSRPRQGCEEPFDERHPLLSSSRRRPGSRGDVIGYCERQRAFALLLCRENRKPKPLDPGLRRDDDRRGRDGFARLRLEQRQRKTRIVRCGFLG